MKPDRTQQPVMMSITSWLIWIGWTGLGASESIRRLKMIAAGSGEMSDNGILAWHFLPDGGLTRFDPRVRVSVDPPIIMYQRGLHASIRLLDALGSLINAKPNKRRLGRQFATMPYIAFDVALKALAKEQLQ